jgi:tRNA(Ser,Leu) C12 N-acetylase TAN1
MNRWKTIKEIQKHATELKKLIYLFEEFEEWDTQPKKPSVENLKNVKFILPLKTSLFSPYQRLAVSIGKRYGVDFDIVDIKELELLMNGKEWTPWVPLYKPVYITKCTKEDEIESATKNLKEAEKELDAECRKIERHIWKIRRI